MAEDAGKGRFVWFDLMTRDPEEAVAFYTRVVGWGTETWEGGGSPYTMWTTGEGPLGGVMDMTERAPAEVPPHWLGYIGTDDVDAATARAAELGATVMSEPRDIPEVGRFSLLQDPQGAAVAFFTPAGEAPGHGGPPHEGEMSWHELATTDPDAAWDFYREIFGWEETGAMDMGDMGTYRMFGRPGAAPLGGIFRKPAEMAGPSAWLYYARVPDVHEGAERVRQAGGRVLNGPMEVPGGDWIVQVMDPGGAAFALHHAAPGG